MIKRIVSFALYQPLFVYAATNQLDGLDFGAAGRATPADGDGPVQIASNQLLIGREGRFRGVTRWFIRSSREIEGELR